MKEPKHIDGKNAKKRRRWWLLPFLPLLGLLVVLSTFLFIIVGTDKGQNLLTDATNEAVNKYLAENASIGEVQVHWPLRIVLHNVVIYDHKDSVLFKTEGLRLTPVWPPIQDSTLLLDQLVLTHFEANLKQYEGDDRYNYAYAFKSSGSGKSKPAIKGVKLRRLIFEEGNFSFNDYHRDPFKKKGEFGIDFYRLHTSGIGGLIDSLEIDENVDAHLNGFSFREKSGFVMRKMNAQMLITDSSFLWTDVSMKTNQGQLDADIAFDFDNWKSWRNFNDSIKINTQIRPSDLYANDIAYFAPQLLNRFTHVKVSGDARGTLSSFRSRNLSLAIGEQSNVKCRLRMSGLPDIDNTFIALDVSESNLVLQEILTELNQPELPKQVRMLGDIRLQGNFTGFTHDFVAKGKMSSALGYAESDIHLSIPPDGQSNYSGNLDLVDFQLGKMLQVSDLGRVTFASELSGSGSKRETLKASLKASVQKLQYKGYNYQNVVINGKVADQYFNGELQSADSNAALSILGTIDFRKKAPVIDINADIQNLALHHLNLSNDSISIKTVTQMNFTGDNLENFVGEIFTQNLDLQVNRKKYATGSAKIAGSLTPRGKLWTLESDVANGSLETSVLLKEIPEALASHGIAMLPKYMGLEATDRVDYIEGSIEVKRASMVNSLLPINIKLDEDTRVYLLLDDMAETYAVDLKMPSFDVNGITLLDPMIKLSKKGEDIEGNASFSRMDIKNASVSGYALTIQNDSQYLYLTHEGYVNDSLFGFKAHHSVAYSETSETQISIDSSKLYFGEDTFQVSSKPITWKENNLFQIAQLDVALSAQRFRINGWADIEGNYDLYYQLLKTRIESFSSLMPDYFAVMTGELNGVGRIRSNNGQPVTEATVIARPVNFRGLDIRSINIKSEFSDESSSLGLTASINASQNIQILKLQGNYLFKPTPHLEVDLSMNKTPARLFEVLTTDIVSNLQGTVSSNLRLNGPIKNLQMDGWMSFDSLKTHIDYLGVDYKLNDTVSINRKNIIFKEVVLTDHREKRALVNGKIEHDLFSKFDLDLSMDCRNFTVLNTKEIDNELYYGELYATGDAGFKGPILSAKVSCDLTTEKGTRFFIPIQEDQGYSQESFIRFVDKNEPTKDYQVNDQTFSLDLNINANTNAETQLIFDKQLGDIIRAVGNGRINMSLSPAGELYMFGDYVIEQGNYLFTAFDLINKRFEIEKGSKISWLGNPYDADIDIRANYYLKANALNLVSSLFEYDQDRLDEYRSTPVPVVAYADLKGSLLNPDITLDFDFISEGGVDVASLQRELDNLQLPEEELTKQVVSLLVLNRFMPVYTSAGSNSDLLGSGVNTGLGDLISNQLTYWLSSISDNLQIDVNYRSGQESVQNQEGDIVLTQSELELALSTTLFNDRVSLNFAYELQNGYSPNKEIAYKVNPDGTAKVLVFQRQTQNPVITYESNTYGFGFFLKREFESLKDLFRKKDPKK